MPTFPLDAPRLGPLDAALAALVVTQVVHGLTPADTSSEGWTGAVVGLLLLALTAIALVGRRAGAAWAPRLALLVGGAVAVGFVAYHATPVRSPVTNPYIGEPVGVPAWVSVALAVAAGAATVVTARRALAVTPLP